MMRTFFSSTPFFYNYFSLVVFLDVLYRVLSTRSLPSRWSFSIFGRSAHAHERTNISSFLAFRFKFECHCGRCSGLMPTNRSFQMPFSIFVSFVSSNDDARAHVFNSWRDHTFESNRCAICVVILIEIICRHSSDNAFSVHWLNFKMKWFSLECAAQSSLSQSCQHECEQRREKKTCQRQLIFHFVDARCFRCFTFYVSSRRKPTELSQTQKQAKKKKKTFHFFSSLCRLSVQPLCFIGFLRYFSSLFPFSR